MAKTDKASTDRKPNFQRGVPACFAPEITKEKLAEYEKLIETQAKGQIAEEMTKLAGMVKKFLETPASKTKAQVVPMMAVKDGKEISSAKCVPLEDKEVERMWDEVPYDDECDRLGVLFDKISNASNKPLRDAAFHLLWYARELTRDREPMTQETLG